MRVVCVEQRADVRMWLALCTQTYFYLLPPPFMLSEADLLPAAGPQHTSTGQISSPCQWDCFVGCVGIALRERSDTENVSAATIWRFQSHPSHHTASNEHPAFAAAPSAVSINVWATRTQISDVPTSDFTLCNERQDVCVILFLLVSHYLLLQWPSFCKWPIKLSSSVKPFQR